MFRLLLGVEQKASCWLGRAQCGPWIATTAHGGISGFVGGTSIPISLVYCSSALSTTCRVHSGTTVFPSRREGVRSQTWRGTWARRASVRSGMEGSLQHSVWAVQSPSRCLATSNRHPGSQRPDAPSSSKEQHPGLRSEDPLNDETATTSSLPSVGSPSSSAVAPTTTKGSSPSEPSEEIFNVPNLLTLSRILSVPFLGQFILTDRLLEATALLFVAGCTDLVDGWLARKWNAYTVFGSIADPAADKLLMTVMVATLGWKGLLPPSLAVLILARDVGLVLLAFRIRYVTLPRPMTLQRYFNPKLPSAQVQPTQVSKYNTFLQLLSVGGALLMAVIAKHQSPPKESPQEAAAGVGSSNSSPTTHSSPNLGGTDWASVLHYPLLALWVLTAGTTLYSGWGYFVGGAGYRNVAAGVSGTGVASRIATRMKEAGERGRRRLKGDSQGKRGE